MADPNGIESTSFVGACLAGNAAVDDVDDWVGRWHDHGGAPRGHSESLHDFLGLSWDEYGLWAERPSLLPEIIAERTSTASGLPEHSAPG